MTTQKTPAGTDTKRGQRQVRKTHNLQGDRSGLVPVSQVMCEGCPYFKLVRHGRGVRRLCIFTGERLRGYEAPLCIFAEGLACLFVGGLFLEAMRGVVLSLGGAA